MWSLPLCLSSPLDSGTALSIIKWHTAIASVIDDPRTHTCFHFDDVRTFFFFWRLSLFLLSLQILRRADKNGECCVFRRERNSGLRHYSSLSVCLSVCLSVSLSLLRVETDVLSQWNSDHDSLLVLFQLPWKQETDHAHWGPEVQTQNNKK